MADLLQDHSESWRPTCSQDALKLRARILRQLRNFFDDEGYLEVETPLLSADVVVDAHIDPFQVRVGSPASDLYLQTSPEAAMKRLLAAGTGSVYQITRSFRQSERGALHNPEFTIVEWYGVETSFFDQMQFTEKMIRAAMAAVPADISAVGHGKKLDLPFARTSYDDAFRRVFSCSALDASIAELKQAFAALQNDGSAGADIRDRDTLLNLMLAECVEPQLGIASAEFLHNYPCSQAALATLCPDDSRTALRFELYIDGMEFCNGYEELTDADELSRRQVEQNRQRGARADSTLPGAIKMEAAMRAGLPRCSGVALGFDRLMMFLGGYQHIDEVIPFPIERA